jgi:Transmembrane secretion effector
MVLVFPDSTADLTPWNHWRMPVIVQEVDAELLEGPVLVTIEYSVLLENEAEFIKAIRQYAQTRRPDGAYQWESIAIPQAVDRFVEIFLVQSWAEHLRQHERQTKADREMQKLVSSYVAGEPKVRNLLYADPRDHSSEPNFVTQSSNDAGERPRPGWPEISRRDVLSLCIQHQAAVVALLRRSAES